MEIGKLILNALGYDSPDELDCANYETAVSEIFSNDFNDDPYLFAIAIAEYIKKQNEG